MLRLLVGLTGGGRGNPIIAFFDSKERTRAYFHHDSVDDTESPALKLFDEDGTRRAELSLNSLGDPRLGEFDAKGQIRTIVGVRVDIDKATWTETRTAENQISMYDANGKIVWQAPPQENEPK